jgi:hypothetical protein
MARKKARVVTSERTATDEEKADELERKKRTQNLVDPQPASVPLERPQEVESLAEELEAMAKEENPESSEYPSKKDTPEDPDEGTSPPPPSNASAARKRKRQEEESEEDPYVDPIQRRKTMGKLWKAAMLALSGNDQEARKIFLEVAEDLGSSALFRLPIWNTLIGELIGSGISIGGVALIEAYKAWKTGKTKGTIEPEYEIKSAPPSSPEQPGPS